VTPRTVIIGVGNPWRGDDAVGWLVAEGARRRLADRAEVVLTDGEPARLLDAWDGMECAVVVDAMCSGAEAGTIRVWSGGAVPPVPPAVQGSHRLGMAAAVGLADALGALPRRMTLVGVEVADVGAGERLSPQVAVAMETAVDLVAGLVLESSR
jgi:hydrogenase maturation protease